MKKNICKIDIHAHILPIDHGSKDNIEAEEMLKEAYECNVNKIVCSAHYYSENYDKTFDRIKKIAKSYNIQLYKGNEVMIYDLEDILNNKANRLGNTNYVLVELQRNNQISIKEVLEKLSMLIDSGYKVIMAHPELVGLSLKDVKKLKEIGIVIQVDAYSYYLKNQSFVSKLLKYDLIDVVASDIHYKNDGYLYLDQFYNYILDKYGYEKAYKLFYDNPRRILYGKGIL